MTPTGEKAFRDGMRALRMLVLEAMNEKDHVMPHTHNPAVREDSQWEYCWRCIIEKAMNKHITDYHMLCR